jgi:F-type H+-transporting ATPase subunit delta
MNSPMVEVSLKDRFIKELQLTSTLTSLLKVMVRKNHMHLFFDVYHDWIRLIRKQQQIAHINVYAAKKLSVKQEMMLKERLQPRFKHMTIDLHLRVDHDLIGGIKIVYQGVSLDKSIARELDELFTTL